MTPEEALRLAALLSDKIRARRPAIATAVQYYKGVEGRMKFASDEFREYFQTRFAGFSDNWCMPVAQAPVERIKYQGTRLGDEPIADLELARAWERNEADRGLAEALLMMTIAKRSFGLVSPTSAGGRLTFEHPDSAAVVYDAQTRARRAGMVMWADEKYEYGELQLPGSILAVKRERIVVEPADKYVPPGVDGWVFDSRLGGEIERVNPLGVVPLVEMRNQALLDNDPISDIDGVMPMQDSINLVWAYLLNGLDLASLPARVVMKSDVPKEPILDANGQVIGSRPVELDQLIRDRIMFLPGSDASIGEWTAANLDVFSKVIEHAIAHIAAQTRTPSHYLIASGSDNVPAAGYELAEAGLVSKATERIAYANPAVRELNRLLALAEGQTARAEQIAYGKVLWGKPQYRSEQQLMDGLLKMHQTGFPFQWIAEEYGLSPYDVKRVMDMVRDEQTDPYLAQIAAKDAAAPRAVTGADADPAPVG